MALRWRHIESNLDVFGFTQTGDQVARIDAFPKDRRKLDPPFAPDWDPVSPSTG